MVNWSVIILTKSMMHCELPDISGDRVVVVVTLLPEFDLGVVGLTVYVGLTSSSSSSDGQHTPRMSNLNVECVKIK